MSKFIDFVATLNKITEETDTMIVYARKPDIQRIYWEDVNKASRAAEIVLNYLKENNKLASRANVKPETKMYWDSITCFLRQIVNCYVELEKFRLEKDMKNTITYLINIPIDEVENLKVQHEIVKKLDASYSVLLVRMLSIYNFLKNETITPAFHSDTMKQTSDMFDVTKITKQTELLPVLEKLVMGHRDVAFHLVHISKTFRHLD